MTDTPTPKDRTLYALATVGVIALAALVLWLMGRSMWGSASGFGLWSGDIHSPFNSQRLTDAYTFTHISHGLLFFMLLWLARDHLATGSRLVVAAVLESAWEVLENTPMVIERFRETTMAQGYYGDSILNSVGDILACVAGFLIATQLQNRWVLALFLALELALVFWIRDSLLLNILMLIYPIPGVREWQAAG